MNTEKRIKYKVVVYDDGTSEIVGPENEQLRDVEPEELKKYNVLVSNVKAEPVLEFNLSNPRIVCHYNRCKWVD